MLLLEVANKKTGFIHYVEHSLDFEKETKGKEVERMRSRIGTIFHFGDQNVPMFTYSKKWLCRREVIVS